jgi:hypothetical protein
MTCIRRLASVKLRNLAISRASAARWRQYSASLADFGSGVFHFWRTRLLLSAFRAVVGEPLI